MAQESESVEDVVAEILDGPDEARAERLLLRLQRRGDAEVLEMGLSLLQEEEALCRSLGVELVGGREGRPYDEAEAALRGLLRREADPGVIATLAGSLARLGAIDAVLPLLVHPGADVRAAATAGLAESDAPGVFEALLARAADGDAEVRRWAAFALGSGQEADDDAVRAALWTLSRDANPETRGEAVLGLILREVPGARDALVAGLRERPVPESLLEAAATLEDAGLLPLLRAIGPDDADPAVLKEARIACGDAPKGRR